MRLRRSTVHTPMRQLLKLEIDTCRVKGQIWTQQDLSIVNATIQHTSDLQTQLLQFNNLTRWFTHLISWFKHQISATGQNALQTAEYQLLLQRYCVYPLMRVQSWHRGIRLTVCTQDLHRKGTADRKQQQSSLRFAQGWYL